MNEMGMKNNDQSLKTECKREEISVRTYNMLQTIAIEQVKEALDQFSKVCIINILILNKKMNLFKGTKVFV